MIVENRFQQAYQKIKKCFPSAEQRWSAAGGVDSADVRSRFVSCCMAARMYKKKKLSVVVVVVSTSDRHLKMLNFKFCVDSFNNKKIKFSTSNKRISVHATFLICSLLSFVAYVWTNVFVVEFLNWQQLVRKHCTMLYVARFTCLPLAAWSFPVLRTNCRRLPCIVWVLPLPTAVCVHVCALLVRGATTCGTKL